MCIRDRYRPYDYRLCKDTCLFGFLEIIYDFARKKFESLVFLKFRNNIMIVGIKPFGHFHGGYIQPLLLVSSGHWKIEVPLGFFYFQENIMIALGNGPNRQ